MSEDLVTIEVDGRRLQAKKGAMLMEVTDAADIYIPRF
ncbi:MAG: 2Fe-2S iron-sulfur cluster-binding protein, partial [Gammaproteobacteria bacterium]